MPRLAIVILWFFTHWFAGVFETKLWPILGFLFMPLTLLWYSAVANWFDGEWNWWRVIVMILAILNDLNSGRSVGHSASQA
jgi:hypothetical protein